jgi:ABC-type dipeptide/oligopeptide/nickel transport system permease subunit
VAAELSRPSRQAGRPRTRPAALAIAVRGPLAVTLFCFNFIGDGLRDAPDPKDR